MAKQNERFDWQASERKRNTHNKKPLAFEIVWRIKCLSRYLDVSRANTIYQTFKCDKMNGILSAVCKAMGMELPIRNPLKSCCHWCCCYFFKIHCHKMKMKKFERECNRIRERDSRDPCGRWTVLDYVILFRLSIAAHCEHSFRCAMAMGSARLNYTLQFNIDFNFLGQTLIKLFTHNTPAFLFTYWFRLSKYRSSLSPKAKANR